ncbi:MAG: hypothetical protein R2909_21015 [Gemmatimonadales bacterium]
MTLPILPFFGGGDALASSGSPSAGAETSAGLAFGVLLSAAGAAPVEQRAPVPEPSLELLLDGEWTLDEQAGGEGPGQPAGGEGDAAASASGDVLVLEKDLSDWLIGRAGGRSVGRGGMGRPPGLENESGRVGLELDGVGPEAAAERNATVFGVDTASRAASSLWQGVPKESNGADRRTVESVEPEPAIESPGSIDAETASREFRALSALIEVAGFVFPIGSEPTTSPAAVSGEEAGPTRPPLPGAPSQGTGGDPASNQSGRLAAAPVEGTGLAEEVETRSWRLESAEQAKPAEEPGEAVLRKHAARIEPSIPTEARADARGPVADPRGAGEAGSAPAERLARRVVFERGTETTPDGQALTEAAESRATIGRAGGGERGGSTDGGQGNGEREVASKRKESVTG